MPMDSRWRRTSMLDAISGAASAMGGDLAPDDRRPSSTHSIFLQSRRFAQRSGGGAYWRRFVRHTGYLRELALRRGSDTRSSPGRAVVNAGEQPIVNKPDRDLSRFSVIEATVGAGYVRSTEQDLSNDRVFGRIERTLHNRSKLRLWRSCGKAARSNLSPRRSANRVCHPRRANPARRSPSAP